MEILDYVFSYSPALRLYLYWLLFNKVPAPCYRIRSSRLPSARSPLRFGPCKRMSPGHPAPFGERTAPPQRVVYLCALNKVEGIDYNAAHSLFFFGFTLVCFLIYRRIRHFFLRPCKLPFNLLHAVLDLSCGKCHLHNPSGLLLAVPPRLIKECFKVCTLHNLSVVICFPLLSLNLLSVKQKSGASVLLDNTA